jgi:hypothetical protein
MSSERSDIDDLGSRLQICATTTARSTSGLTGALLQRPWVKQMVGLGRRGWGECGKEEREGKEAPDR